MELIDLKSLNLKTEESGDIIKFLAQKRGITTKKSTIKLIYYKAKFKAQE